jgi:hypothetical protein
MTKYPFSLTVLASGTLFAVSLQQAATRLAVVLVAAGLFREVANLLAQWPLRLTDVGRNRFKDAASALGFFLGLVIWLYYLLSGFGST